MSRVCRECAHYVLPDWKVEQVGRCLLSKKKFDREVKLPTEFPACKGFEKKDQGRKR